jgi:hypothetical protein
MTGDGWTFEHQFRKPIRKFAGFYTNNPITIAPEISTRINILKQKI